MISKLQLAIKAIKELGPSQVSLYAAYRLGLRTGYLHWKTNRIRKHALQDPKMYPLRTVFQLPDPDLINNTIGESGLKGLLLEADEIVSGKVRLFGGQPINLSLSPISELEHWTKIEENEFQIASDSPRDVLDPKFIWEPARFDWAYTLGRAFFISQDEKYARSFWQYFKEFNELNPPDLGANWVSAQEVSLRLIALTFAHTIFKQSIESTPQREELLARSLVEHAIRIPATLSYARAQNNNHLLSEAAGLFTAGTALPDHPDAPQWREQGWHWFNEGMRSQISEDGAYIQHSTNYHRLMLQLALWVNLISDHQELSFPEKTKNRIRMAVRWLIELCDHENGSVPNLGPNDGAYILPLTNSSFNDYRPVLGAASVIFLGEKIFPKGEWDEMLVWFNPTQQRYTGQESPPVVKPSPNDLHSPHILRSPSGESWAYLRVANFKSRPGHADQMHLDLWWRGINLALDPGTYRYTAEPPWDNSLRHTNVHNTITINHQDQMTDAGRFLYLDWSQGSIIEGNRNPDGSWSSLTAQHNGYNRFGLIHRRQVTPQEDERWIVLDQIQHADAAQKRNTAPATVLLHWLLPDWSWSVQNDQIILNSPMGEIALSIHTDQRQNNDPLYIIRAGELVHGSGAASNQKGWHSPSYNQKIPALSINYEIEVNIPFSVTTTWQLPELTASR